MTIRAKTLFPLVRRDFLALALSSAGHVLSCPILTVAGMGSPWKTQGDR
jgi:hypothetical protein